MCLYVGAASAAAQDVGAGLPRSPFNQGPFRFDGGARRALQALWQASVHAREERVACLGGYRRDGVTYITRVESLAVPGARYGSVPHRESLQRCGPPDWLGTVHTHIATFGDGRAFVTFSSNDRRVMSLWRATWHTEGVFCVLYSDYQAHCEAEPDVSSEPKYDHPRGNRILSTF